MNKHMKKVRILILIISIGFLVFTTGCGKVEIALYDGSRLIDTVKVSAGEKLSIDPPTKEGYNFICWLDEDGNEITNDSIINKKTTLKAKFEIASYTYKFVVDGEVIKEETLEYQSDIEYPKRPYKKPNQEYTYEFIGWDHEDEVLLNDITFNALFKEIKNEYKCTFLDRDGIVLKEEKLEYGVTPVPPTSPSKANTSRYKYTFTGWDNEIVPVTDKVTYRATYSRELINPVTTLKGLKISFLGDSITTFYKEGSPVNSYYHEDGQYYYPKYCASVDSYEKTWWGQLYLNNEMILGVNNSWSGSTAYGTSSSSAMTDGRINTLVENGDPDIIIVFIGTNDCASIYTDMYTPEHYELALQTIIDKIRALCDADIFFIELAGKSTYKNGEYKDRCAIFNASLEKVANLNECPLIPLQNHVEDSWFNDNLHFGLTGAKNVSEMCTKYLKEYYGLE